MRYSQPTRQAEEEWVAEIKRLAVVAARFLQNCTPGYYNNEGLFCRTLTASGRIHTPLVSTHSMH